MVFVNPWDASEKFIPVLINCFLDLKSLACSMANDNMRRTSLNEFLYKLKCLEKELYMVSNKLKETFKKNECLNKDLECEKEKSRKKTAKIKVLETQLASAEFKLKVRSTQKNDPLSARMKKTKDVHIQTEYDVDNSSDMFNTVRNLRRTAQSTLVTIRNMIIGQGDAPMTNLPLQHISEGEDAEVSPKKSKSSHACSNYVDVKAVQATSETATSEQYSNSSIFTASDDNVGEDGYEDDDDFEEDSDFPYKLLKSMQNRVRKLKMKNVEISDISNTKMAAALDEQKQTSKVIQQQLNMFLGRKL